MLDNKIGTYCALFYDTYATALSERGKMEEAIKMVEQGIDQKAQPVKKLQKRLESLKQLMFVSQSKATAPSKPPGQAASSTWHDEQVCWMETYMCTCTQPYRHTFPFMGVMMILCNRNRTCWCSHIRNTCYLEMMKVSLSLQLTW